jgi:predicted outer membrane repeat protein
MSRPPIQPALNRKARRAQFKSEQAKKNAKSTLSALASSSLLAGGLVSVNSTLSFATTCDLTFTADDAGVDATGWLDLDYLIIDHNDGILTTDTIYLCANTAVTVPTLNFSQFIASDLTIKNNSAFEITFDGAYGERFSILDNAGDVDVTFDGLKFENFTNDAVIRADFVENSSSLTILNSEFSGNETGVYVTGDGYQTVTVSGSVFQDNDSDIEGGAILVKNLDLLSISASDFTDNSSNRHGGAVFAAASNVSITADSSFIGNEADNYFDGGAVYAQSYNDDIHLVTVSNSVFEGNIATSDGGAIAVDRTSLTVSTSTFRGNRANGSDGGAIFVDGAGYDYDVNGEVVRLEANVLITNSTFTNNYADDDGGAIKIEDEASLRIIGGSFSGNIADDDDGGAIDALADSRAMAELYISGVTFTGNSTRDSDGGGAIHSDGLDLTILESIFTGNWALSDRGGAVEFDGVRESSERRQLRIERSTFTDNWAADKRITRANLTTGGAGGAVSVTHGDFQIIDTKFSDNLAETGGAVRIGSEASGQMRNSELSGNEAMDRGGALFTTSINSQLTIFNNAIHGNTSYYRGSALYAGAASLVVVNNTFSENSFSSREDTGYEDILAASKGGLVFSFNTFVDDTATVTYQSGPYSDSTAHREVVGNLFTEVGALTTVGFEDAQVQRNLVGFSSSGLNLVATSQSSRLHYVPNPGTEAVDYVPTSSISAFVSTTFPLDQIGTARSGPWNAGSIEFGQAANGEAFVPPFRVTSKTQAAIAGRLVTIRGVNLRLVEEVFVDGVRVQITSKTNKRLTFRTPKGLTGSASLSLFGAGTTFIVDNALRFPFKSTSRRAVAVVPGFAANSTVLSTSMKREIRQFVRANRNLTTVTCKGFTSAPATPQDIALARQRGQVTCDFIKRLNPNLDVRVLQGSHTDEPGQNIRRVRIVMR